jgi:hypothetical protein
MVNDTTDHPHQAGALAHAQAWTLVSYATDSDDDAARLSQRNLIRQLDEHAGELVLNAMGEILHELIGSEAAGLVGQRFPARLGDLIMYVVAPAIASHCGIDAAGALRLAALETDSLERTS